MANCAGCGIAVPDKPVLCTQCDKMQNGKSRNMPPGAVGVGMFIGLTILFCIPVIGWIIGIGMATSASNHILRNYARAQVICIVAAIALFAAAYSIINRYVIDIGWAFEHIKSLFESFDSYY